MPRVEFKAILVLRLSLTLSPFIRGIPRNVGVVEWNSRKTKGEEVTPQNLISFHPFVNCSIIWVMLVIFFLGFATVSFPFLGEEEEGNQTLHFIHSLLLKDHLECAQTAVIYDLLYLEVSKPLTERDFYSTSRILLRCTHLGHDWLSTQSAVAGAPFMNEFAPYAMQASPPKRRTRQRFTEFYNKPSLHKGNLFEVQDAVH